MQIDSLKWQIFNIIKLNPPKPTSGKIFDVSLIVLITTNIVTTFQQYFIPATYDAWDDYIHMIKEFSLVFFTAEYVLRIWTAVYKAGYEHPIKGRIKYMFSFYMIIDILAIIPFYFYQVDSFLLRILRVFKMLKLLKVMHFMKEIVDYNLGKYKQKYREKYGTK
ncbi:ion transporter [Alkalibacillus silvisoli]|uniref:Ion transport domain-containing protein n=1 Tax=Alkalibacillus silvisoli TaxID=392823 RepID=A0ABN1ABG2_9BACI